MGRMIGIFLMLAAGVAGAEKKHKCVTQAAADKQQAAAEAFSAKSFKKALAKTKLTLVALPSRDVVVEEQARREIGTIFTETVDGKEKSFLAGPTYLAERQGRPDYLLATDKAGNVWHVARAPKETTVSVTVCGCDPRPSGGPPPIETQVVYELPEGKSYQGDVEVVYAAKVVALAYTNQRPKGHPPCRPE
jgi:hypothetical protein